MKRGGLPVYNSSNNNQETEASFSPASWRGQLCIVPSRFPRFDSFPSDQRVMSIVSRKQIPRGLLYYAQSYSCYIVHARPDSEALWPNFQPGPQASGERRQPRRQDAYRAHGRPASVMQHARPRVSFPSDGWRVSMREEKHCGRSATARHSAPLSSASLHPAMHTRKRELNDTPKQPRQVHLISSRLAMTGIAVV